MNGSFNILNIRDKLHASENHYLLYANCQESPIHMIIPLNIKETNKLLTINHNFRKNNSFEKQVMTLLSVCNYSNIKHYISNIFFTKLKCT